MLLRKMVFLLGNTIFLPGLVAYGKAINPGNRATGALPLFAT
jgi:hypothetical protein